MAVREILIYPEKVLKEVCKPVDKFDDELKTLVEDMAETMYAAPGVGLAANQIGVGLRVFVIDTVHSDEESDLHVFVNPEIVEQEGEIVWEEGCLSFPDVHLDVKRFGHVKVRAQNLEGDFFEIEADELFAVAVQHELDHLNGKTMADKMGYLKKKMIIKDMMKLKKEKRARE